MICGLRKWNNNGIRRVENGTVGVGKLDEWDKGRVVYVNVSETKESIQTDDVS